MIFLIWERSVFQATIVFKVSFLLLKTIFFLKPLLLYSAIKLPRSKKECDLK